MELTTETINELRKPEVLKHLNDKLNDMDIDSIVVPEGYNIRDLVRYRSHRDRLTGTMNTNIVDSFKGYVEEFMPGDIGTLVFIDSEQMAANCAINFGTMQEPGHVDHWAKLKLTKTSEYKSVLKVTDERRGQRETAEWCEDFVQFCTFIDADGETVPAATAAKAIRSLKIESNTTSTSGEGSFNREKSLLESTKVDTSAGLPHFIAFKCVPYTDLKEREFKLRLGTGRDREGNTTFLMQIVRHDIEVQEMAQELADLITSKMDKVTVFMGDFSK